MIRHAVLRQHVTVKNARERGCVARVSEFQSKPNLAAGQKGHLEQARLGFVVIDPASHLSHDDAQIGAATANLDNVHATPPLSAEERSGRETGRYVAFERGLRKRPIHPATI